VPRVKSQPLIAVKDVLTSSKWYQKLLNAKNLGGGTDHDHIYDRILVEDHLVLQLHSWNDENHPNLVDPQKAPVGHGVLLWFEVDDFKETLERIAKLEAEVIEDTHFNPGPQLHEIWIRDLDDYVVVIAGTM